LFTELWNLNKRVKKLERENKNRLNILAKQCNYNRLDIDKNQLAVIKALKDFEDATVEYIDMTKLELTRYIDEEFAPPLYSRLDEIELFIDRIKRDLDENPDNPKAGGTLH